MSKSKPKPYDKLMAKLYDISTDQHGRHRSNFVYRGHDDSSWNLETSLQRLGEHSATVEGPLLRNFIKYSVDRDLASQSLLYQLAFAQHHGLPTRVLDWSTSPKIALHFSVGDESKYGEDGEIWAADVIAIKSKLPDKLKKELEHHRAYVFSVDMLSKIRSLKEFDKTGDKSDFALFFEPPSLDSRIVNQAAILSIMPSPTSLLHEYLDKHPDTFKRIIVPKELKWEIRDKLDQDQINERMLFPGEDGTARWLKRYYGPGPNGGSTTTKTPAFTGPMKGRGT